MGNTQAKTEMKDEPRQNSDHVKKVVDQIIDITYDNMDDHNKKAVDVMKTKGMSAAIEHMFTDQDTGRQLTYGEMRARYG
tara:strand:+ start:57 stop:296 length:240 start_codon:yes stop_codon:yes gene_type:complete